jgi:hypothetical protein
LSEAELQQLTPRQHWAWAKANLPRERYRQLWWSWAIQLLVGAPANAER